MKLPVPIFNYSIKNASSDEVNIYIDGDIVDASTQAILKDWFGDDTSTSFKSFRDQLNAVEAKVYNVYINSGGGMVTDAMAIHDLLREMQTKGKTVNTIGRGIIASAATYILMAGKNSRMSKNSWFMIHNVSGGVWGDVNLVESYAGTLRKFNDRSRDFYSEATGIRKEDITKMMNAETWMTADEAKQKGFIKEIDGEAEFTNAIASDKWLFSNMAVLNSYNAAVKRPPAPTNNSELINQKFDEMKKFFQDLGNAIMASIKGVKAPENNDHTALMTSIGEAVQTSFTNAAEQFETAVDDMITQGIDFTKEGPAQKAIADAVTNATKDLNGTITTLQTDLATAKKKNEDLEKEILQIKGGKASGQTQEKPTVQIGSFSE